MSQAWRGGSQYRRPRTTKPPKPCANPIFESWIQEWREDAEAKDSKMKYVYAKALQSLRKYPLPLSSGKECSILENFGAHMCKMIDNRMAKENMFPGDDTVLPGSSGGQGLSDVIDLTDDAPVSSSKRKKGGKAGGKSKKRAAAVDVESDEDVPQAPVVKQPPKQKKQYVPAYRSGGYAILVALMSNEMRTKNPAGTGMSKSELQREAQKYCEASLTKPDFSKNTHFTAWNSMKSLSTKELVIRIGCPAQYYLTPEGRELAQKLVNAEAGVGNPQSGEHTASQSDQDTDEVDENEVATSSAGYRLEPGKFEIVLYVDTCETNGRSKPQEVINELQKNGVTLYVNKLSVGDFVWVCREITESSSNRNRLTISSSKELILPFVVERKRADDLAHSIRDGRFHEQKFRLMNTKLQPIYLIESYGKGDWGLGEGALGQAICNTQISNGFQIQETNSIKETCAYLTFMTRHLKSMYENKTLIGFKRNDWINLREKESPGEVYLMYFNDFNESSVKKTNWKANEMFARHLMRMKGVSADKACAIIQKYPTLHHLFTGYADCDSEKQKEMLLQPILFGTGGRKIGPSISRKLCHLYNTSNLS